MPGFGQSGTSRISFFRASMGMVFSFVGRPGSLLLNRKAVGITRHEFGFLFDDARDARGIGAAFERRAQILVLPGVADGINLHTAVAQIAHKTRDSQPLRHAHGKEPVAHGLDLARDEVTLRRHTRMAWGSKSLPKRELYQRPGTWRGWPGCAPPCQNGRACRRPSCSVAA